MAFWSKNVNTESPIMPPPPPPPLVLLIIWDGERKVANIWAKNGPHENWISPFIRRIIC